MKNKQVIKSDALKRLQLGLIPRDKLPCNNKNQTELTLLATTITFLTGLLIGISSTLLFLQNINN